jgi:glucose-1-phosphate thymidylyltransferase
MRNSPTISSHLGSERYNESHAASGFCDPSTMDLTSRLYSNKLGAIGDIKPGEQSRESGRRTTLIVVAGDNLFSESLQDFGRFSRERNHQPSSGVYDVWGVWSEAKKYGGHRRRFPRE